MQDRYFGDIGDFVKYRLLRSLCGFTEDGGQLSLGVVWYLNEEAGDGKFVDYLDDCDSPYRTADKVLFDRLKCFRQVWTSHEMNYRRSRNVRLLEGSGLFPDAVWYSTCVPPLKNKRSMWLQAALEAVRGRRVVFLDPDNGLVPSTLRHGKMAAKYLLWEELEAFCSSETSPHVVIYQHRRRIPLEEQIDAQTREIRCRIAGVDLFAIVPPKASRVFYVIPSRRDRDRPTFNDRVIGLPSDVRGEKSRRLSVGSAELESLGQDTDAATRGQEDLS